MKRILFVEDDPNVLQGLQRMLYPLRRQWEMVFAQSGAEALQLLAANHFDVVVTDLRMPQMDGVQFLTEVRRRHPDTVRITLSGDVGQTVALRSVGPAHQCLAKPCDPETLQNVIARACALRELLSDEALKGVVSRMSSLPALPDLYLQLVDELRSPDASLQTIGALLAQDLGMTAKVLQLVNSAFFGLPRRVSSPAQAVNLLGLETVKALVLSAHIFSQLDEADIEGFCLRALEMHSLATGILARRILATRQAPGAGDDHTLTAGLLHDIGKLVLAVNLPDRYGKVVVLARDQSLPVEDAERQVLGTTHGEVGAYLLGLWGLPDPIVEVAAFHHHPRQCPGTRFGALTAVHVADVLEHEHNHSADSLAGTVLDLDYLTRTGCAEQLPAWRELAQTVLKTGGPA
jgi:HD-like signal output (HDOD) protein/CheY-like chemotaxis protein